MLHVYAISSLRVHRIYIGYTSNIDKRLKYHNSGYVKSTSRDKPWKLIALEQLATREEARWIEYSLKKSKGNIVNPMDMIDKYGVDAFRYFLIAEMKLGKDCNFTEEIFVARYNAELANNLGNLVNRVMTMILKHCDGKIPAAHEQTPSEKEIEACALETAQFVEDSITSLGLDKIATKIIEFLSRINKYFEDNAPWSLIKNNDREGFERVLYTAAESLRIVSGLLQPLMPAKMKALRKMLGLKAEDADMPLLREWHILKEGTPVGNIIQLFPRVEFEGSGSEGQDEKVSEGEKQMISFDEFKKIELRTAVVKTCEKVEKSEKLLKMTVDLGDETRTIVAGVAADYKPEEMVGKSIVVVANLEPATLFGIESKGMLLAADTGKGHALIISDREAPPGSPVS